MSHNRARSFGRGRDFRIIVMPMETGSSSNPSNSWEATRLRYWARSLIGWRRFGRALHNDGHHALARLEAMGRPEVVLSQNVDRLHQAADNDRLIDLHGRLDLVRCMGCGRKMMREELQDDLSRLNADWLDLDAADAPDGDADLEARELSSFSVPTCPDCDRLLKPDVVFFGATIAPIVFATQGRGVS
jgi:NAD-dependent SIR2 family protein deacetylase